MVMPPILKFSRNFSKLKEKQFRTLRRYDRYKVGKILTVKSPKLPKFEVLVVEKLDCYFGNIADEFLTDDTDTETREEAIKMINSFYKKKITDGEIVTIITLVKLETRDN